MHDFTLTTAFPGGERRLRDPEGAIMEMRVDNRSRPSCVADTATPMSRGRGYRRGGGLLDLAQAAKYLGTSERHLRRLLQERRHAAIKIGRRVRFTYRDLDAFIEANRHRGKEDRRRPRSRTSWIRSAEMARTHPSTAAKAYRLFATILRTALD